VYQYGDEGSVRTARYLSSLLDHLGYHVEIHSAFTGNGTVNFLPGFRGQASISAWALDYTLPSDFIEPLFSCSTLIVDTANSNYSNFCSHAIDAKMRRADALQANGQPAQADAVWRDIEKRLLALAPTAPLNQSQAVYLLGQTVRNFQFNAFEGPLVDQLWVK
jgi:ABC-type transport system substrate-binding protein